MNLNAAHLHVVINHLPILGLPMALLLVLWASMTKNQGMLKFALGFTVVVAAFTVATQLSGEPAEEFIEHMPFFSESSVHSHEESAEVTTILACIAGFFSLAQLFWGGASAGAKRALTGLTLAALVAATIGGTVTGFKGGQIRHDEFKLAPAAGGEQEKGGGENAESGEEHENGEKDTE